ncbi:MAG: putative toxin-antitoxin system toxin component, PIN family [Deltaproteobacteria bacterium]|nr:putative toxin-antitoxin system toxin component, PIN family [Deltaproteobacteria bacterium]
MQKVVFDTNVYISAFITRGGKAEQAWGLALEGKVEVCTSVAILTEMAGKLRKKFHWRDELIEAIIKHIAKTARVIKPSIKINMLADEPDNRILECAQEAGAEIIVTGDKHLLDLVAFDGIKIIRIADFISTFL